MANSSCWWASRRTACCGARRLAGGDESPSDALTVAPHPAPRGGGFRHGIAENSRCSPDPHHDRKGLPAGGGFRQPQEQSYRCLPCRRRQKASPFRPNADGGFLTTAKAYHPDGGFFRTVI